MNIMPLQSPALDKIATLQRGEITEHRIYIRIAGSTRDAHNREVLSRIASQEYEHYLIWKKYTSRDVAPDSCRVWFYYLLSRAFGITFAIKLMEGIEKRAQLAYHEIGTVIPEAKDIIAHEESPRTGIDRAFG